jgi:cold shock CspA family protein
MNTHKLHAEFNDPRNNSVILHMLCLVTHYFVEPLLFHCTILFNNEKSPPFLELKIKVFFHISNIREPENRSCQPNNPLEFQVCNSASTICQYSSSVLDIIQLHLL